MGSPIREYFANMAKSPLFATYLIVMCFYFLKDLLGFFIPLHLDALGFSGWEIGILVGIGAVSGLVLEFGIGILTDRVSFRYLVAAGLALTAFFLFGLSLSASFLFFIVVFLAKGVGRSLVEMSTDSFTLKQDHLPPGERFGIYKAVGAIPGALGLIAGGFLLFAWDFPLVLRLSAFLLLVLIIACKWIPENQKSIEKVKSYFQDFRDPKVLFFAILIFFFTSHWGLEEVAYGLFLRENLGLSLTQSGLFMGLPIIFLGLAAIAFGRAHDKGFTGRQLLLSCFILSGIGFLGMGLANNPLLAFSARVLHEIGDGAFGIFLFGGAHSLFGKARMGGDYGLIRVVVILGQLLGALLYSPIGAAYGYHVPHIICGALIAAAGVAMLAFKK
jgi:MFS family permease